MTDTAPGSGDGPLATLAGPVDISSPRAVLVSLRQLIVTVLQLITLFAAIGGKPWDGFLVMPVTDS